MTKKIPIGVDNFKELVSPASNYLFVDKSLMIKELINNGTKVSLIIRPRRWGKTLNMSMLRYFFAPEVNGHPTKEIFDNLKIAQEENGAYLKDQGNHPVIFISLKNIKEDSWENFCQKVAVQIASTFGEYETLLIQSDKLPEGKKQLYKKIRYGEGNLGHLADSLKLLSDCLYCHYGKKVIILIDEYDTPLNAAYNEDYFEKVVNFFKNMFGAALKGNDALEKGVMTGILRLSKNRMLSDINNLNLYSLMDEPYSRCFGFSETEVKDLFSESSLTVDIKAVQHWYNGYRSGSAEGIYNPWSVLKCIDAKGALKPYWIKTGDEELLKNVILNSSKATKEQLTLLLTGSCIESPVDEYLSFDQIKSDTSEALWSLLWATGYLKVFGNAQPLGARYKYHLKIPNYEVECSYRDVFLMFMRSLDNIQTYDSFLKNLVAGNTETFVKELSTYMLTIPSWFDFPKESNYHTFLLGLTASLKETHEIYSNKEIGLGRPDMLLIPRDTQNPLGIILEFKRAEADQPEATYKELADQAFEQISIKSYAATLQTVPYIQTILKVCLVFYGKQFVYRWAKESLAPKAGISD